MSVVWLHGPVRPVVLGRAARPDVSDRWRSRSIPLHPDELDVRRSEMPDVETITDAATALDRCGDLFRSDPIGCNLVATGVLPQGDVEVLRVHEGADTLGVALISGQLCTLSTCSAAVADVLAPMLNVEQPIQLSGPAGVVADLAGLLGERCSGAVVEPLLNRMYRAAEVVGPSKRRRGKAFVGERDRIEQAAQWGIDFGRETGLERSFDDSLAQMTRAVNESRLIEWRSKGEVVSQLLISAARFGVVRLGQLYTPPEHRKKGHGAAFVAAVAQQQLDRQKVDTVILSAPASNVATTRMYRGLGFVRAYEMLNVSVVPG